MRVNLRDVALKAGVSINTASGVLNSRSSSRLSEATRERVQHAAATLGYHPNQLAGSLRSGKTATIGLILSELNNPYFLGILRTLERLAAEVGYRILLEAVNGEEDSEKDVGLLRGWPVDGVLLCTRNEQIIKAFLGPQMNGVPYVYLGYGREEADEACVSFDLLDGGRQVMHHLVDRGCKRIAFVSPPDYLGPVRADFRFRAYEEISRQLGRKTELILVGREGDAREEGLAAGEQIARLAPGDRPDGLICHNDLVAIGVYRALRRAGIDIPGEIKLVGFDNIPDIKYMEVPLTTVDTPIEELCSAALRILLARIGGTAPGPQHTMLIPTRLIPGGSS